MKDFLVILSISSFIWIGNGLEVGGKCKKFKDGRLNRIADSEDCSKFLECDGIWEEQNCPLGTMFDLTEFDCAPEGLVDCSRGKNIVKRHYSYQRRHQHHPGQICYQSVHNQDVLTPHPYFCSKFLRCVHGKWAEEDCQEGLHFSWSHNGCHWPEVANCSMQTNALFTSNDRNHPQEHTDDNYENLCPIKYKKHHFDCTKYYECSEGYWTEKSCPDGLNFNDHTNHCEWYQEPTEAPQTAKVPKNDYSCPEEFQPHEKDCTKFYHCSMGIWYTKDCPEGLHFSESTNRCDWPSTSGCSKSQDNQNCCSVPFKPNPLDCKSFYQCYSDGEWVLRQCSGSYEYNVRTDRCEPAEVAGCSSTFERTHETSSIPSVRPLPTTTSRTTSAITSKPRTCVHENSMYPNLSDCSKYQICSGGYLVDRDCPSDLHFSVPNARCIEKSQAKCFQL